MRFSLSPLIPSMLYFVPALSEFVAGFNYGAYWANDSIKTRSDFEIQFKRAKQIQATAYSARLFTTIQPGTNRFSDAIEAAIHTQTTLLVGMWPQDNKIDLELDALNNALQHYGRKLSSLVVGISVGSEDLYRSTATCSPDCADASTVAEWIKFVRSNLTNGEYAYDMSSKPIGHVDTISAWTSDSIGVGHLVSVCDFIGVTIYPFWSGVAVESSAESFYSALQESKSLADTKPLFICETGWPWSGDDRGDATVGAKSMESYWKSLGCYLLEHYKTWWFQLQDDSKDGYLWGILDNEGNSRFDITCDTRRTVTEDFAVQTWSMPQGKESSLTPSKLVLRTQCPSVSNTFPDFSCLC